MPPTRVLFFQERNGRSPVLDWLAGLRRRDPKAFAKCMAVIDRLEALGHELRRPTADFLRDGLYELRARRGNVNHRLLYFFHGKGVAGRARRHEGGCDLRRGFERALRWKRAFEEDPDSHTYRE
jgi:hypothetical protein